MECVTVNASKRYQIHIESGLISRCGSLCSTVVSGKKLLLLTDHHVEPLYASTVKKSLESSGFTVYTFTVPAGENSKSTRYLLEIVSLLAENHFTRADALVALGGGVVGDLGGFCAATYLRGISFIQIPTTLLACVDSSVGGKTAVNLPEGKNLFGAFYQPDLVICDPDTLQTLSPAIYADGMAEVIKYGMIWDASLFSALEEGTIRNAEIIRRCVTIKSEIVGKDETDKGLRQILNFGHTIGHAIEKCSNFSISHGSAVAIGMATLTRALVSIEGLNPQIYERLLHTLRIAGLPIFCDFDAEALYAAALSDKKRKADALDVILVPDIGKYEIRKIPISKFKTYIEAGLAE
ncbi:MAG: 3-dehydroquinate synthase [Clostridia bacterium]|nr:3-dehydroquinate synthase [Clostridia bacterium]